RDELLVDIETDKVVLEVVAPADGTLRNIFKNEGDTVQSNEVIAVLDAGKSEAAVSTAAPESVPASAVAQVETVASPSARKIAAEKGIALDTVPGTGRDGRITKEDVLSFESPAAASQTVPAV